MKKLVKSYRNRSISGVCGGIGEYLNVDPTLIRLAFILITLFGSGAGVMLYLACMIVMPSDVY